MKNANENYGPWALITGTSSGIGKEISEQLAQQGLKSPDSSGDALKL
ncbi:MAG: NADP-dependent 3-hydroxy acid dehydrogenase YdfG [Granulosicoccus sp.]|jgi:NADP-dependent 3-hydroxy acid dehydrogenase YdfG